jgi:adenylate kinase
MESGKFVDDQTILGMVVEALKQLSVKGGKYKGVLFDGFPRTIAQATALQAITHVDAVLDIQVGDAEVIRRISSRWMVDNHGEQHTFSDKAAADAYVVKNGGKAFQRHDDTPSVVQDRLKVYHELTEPLLHYYGNKQQLFIINGEKAINRVWKDVKLVLERVKSHKAARHMHI